MMKYILLLTSALALTACSSGSLFESWDSEDETSAAMNLPGGSVYKVEKPYEINGVWYFPAENYSYSEKGLASWYMPAAGKSAKTANGEEYIATEMTARHKTLPLPSIVRITNLENNKSIIARVNDRGPMVNNRLIDVSQKAAQELGFPVTGTTQVMVEVLPQESQEVRDALLAADRVFTEEGRNHDLSIVPPMPVPTSTEDLTPVYVKKEPAYTQPVEVKSNKTIAVDGVYIQLGAFGNAANAAKAERVASSVTEVVTTTQTRGNQVLSVVKAGPYANRAAAANDLQRLKELGYKDAFISK